MNRFHPTLMSWLWENNPEEARRRFWAFVDGWHQELRVNQFLEWFEKNVVNKEEAMPNMFGGDQMDDRYGRSPPDTVLGGGSPVGANDEVGPGITPTAAQEFEEANRRDPNGLGYHLADIPKGELGESSKIMEELLELQDAEAQGARVMALVELSDLVGSIEAYLERHHPGVSLGDLKVMAYLTRRAFRNGRR